MHVPESPKEPTNTPEYEDDLPDYGHAEDDSPGEHESPQPWTRLLQYWSVSGAPDGAATDLFADKETSVAHVVSMISISPTFRHTKWEDRRSLV